MGVFPSPFGAAMVAVMMRSCALRAATIRSPGDGIRGFIEMERWMTRSRQLSSDRTSRTIESSTPFGSSSSCERAGWVSSAASLLRLPPAAPSTSVASAMPLSKPSTRQSVRLMRTPIFDSDRCGAARIGSSPQFGHSSPHLMSNRSWDKFIHTQQQLRRAARARGACDALLQNK